MQDTDMLKMGSALYSTADNEANESLRQESVMHYVDALEVSQVVGLQRNTCINFNQDSILTGSNFTSKVPTRPLGTERMPMYTG
jgi:hypothetical protein